MRVVTELGYALICQVKEEEKNNVVLKMLLQRRGKHQQEIEMDSLQDCNYFQLKCSPSWICLVTLSRQLFAKGILCIRDLFHKDHVFFLK